MSTETAMDAKIARSPVTSRTASRRRERARDPHVYMASSSSEQVAGEWNDDPLEMILQTLQSAGTAALDDVEVFKGANRERGRITVQ